MGSKARFAKEILPIILKDRKPDQWYVEPFCGGMGTMGKVKGLRLAADKNKYLIAMWKGLQVGKDRPREISKNLYSTARLEFNNGTNIEMDDFMIGWIGWMASFNGRFFDGGYSGIASGRNYIQEQIKNTEKQIEKIGDIIFKHSDYDKLEIPDKSIVYCDIPYTGTKQYSTSKDFKHENFWEWCRKMRSIGHVIFVSEYTAPVDFTCVWEKIVTNSMNTTKTYKPTERLFTLL